MAVVPGMDYNHIVHGGSYYWQNMGIMNTAVFDALYD